MKIRAFEIEDQNAVIELWKACGLVVPWNDPVKDIARKLKVDADLFLVGESNREIVASVMGGYDGHRGWINYLAVSPQHQRKGYARKIMQFVEHRIELKGCPKINLMIRATNREAAEFYQAIGYDIETSIGLARTLHEGGGYL
jgi:ribosomal protein S18 acetylase RimI-like enzyme